MKKMIILLCLCSTTVFAQNRYFVNQTNGANSNDGKSWSKAFGSLQRALDEVKAGDEIWVAAGIYRPSQKFVEKDAEGKPASERYATFLIPNGVKLFGGFPSKATNSTGMNDRDWEINQTILSGDLNNDDGEDFTNMEENAYHVVILLNTDKSTVIDGFTISDGNFNVNWVFIRYTRGSGIVAEASSNSSPTLRNLIIERNVSRGGGAGFSNVSSTGDACPVISNTIFRNNKSGEYGGGFANEAKLKSSPILENVIFSGNQAYIGGGMYCLSETTETSPVLTNVLVHGNKSTSDAGGMYFTSYAGNVRPTLTNVTISGNKAGNIVGGLLCYAYLELSLPQLRNTVSWGNKAKVMESFDFYNEDKNETPADLQNCQIGDQVPIEVWPLLGSQEKYLNLIGDQVPIEQWPGFVRPIDADNAPTTEGDYRPAKGSQLINQGKNTFVTAKVDLAGKSRIVDETVDIGAYEYQEKSIVSVQEMLAARNIWAEQGNLYVRTDRPATVRIYTVDGILVQQIKLSESLQAIPLPTGVYFVSLDNEKATKIYISK
jgi:hypothetical protein